jgi:hypothetical protein
VGKLMAVVLLVCGVVVAAITPAVEASGSPCDGPDCMPNVDHDARQGAPCDPSTLSVCATWGLRASGIEVSRSHPMAFRWRATTMGGFRTTSTCRSLSPLRCAARCGDVNTGGPGRPGHHSNSPKVSASTPGKKQAGSKAPRHRKGAE